MSEERETHTITTPVKEHTVVVLDWINGREKQKIDGIMFRSVEANRQNEKDTMTMGESLIADQENLRFEIIVVSVDGSKENIVERIGDMRVKDFEFINKHCEKIAEGDFDEKKETSSETITGESLPPVEPEKSTTPDSQ